MELNKILTNFIIFAALALNIEFVLGDFDNINEHNLNILYIAIVINIISTIAKFGENNELGNLIVSSSILALVQLIITAITWFYFDNYEHNLVENSREIVSIAFGALIFNSLSVIMLIIDTTRLKR